MKICSNPKFEREDTDEVLRQERSKTDEALSAKRRKTGKLADVAFSGERNEEFDALVSLLPFEREKTDRCLLTERACADEAIAHRDVFMGMVCHDLRNLLNSIAINSKLLATQKAQSWGHALTLVHTNRIERCVAQMSRVIGDLVDVSGIEAGKLVVHPYPGDIAELITESLTPFKMPAAEKGVHLNCNSIGRSLPAVFDRLRMLQVLTNLISNAIRFTPSGGTITLEAGYAGDDLRISVMDTGEGIPEESRQTIFERFRQDGENDHGGLGLGLYISKCLVDAQGGRIWAETNPDGKGAVFNLTIPAAGKR